MDFDEIKKLLVERRRLVDDVLYYSGNEKAGYAQIDRLNNEIVIKLARILNAGNP